jgi:hypothetical protein
MGLRTKTELSIEVGLDNALDDLVFERDVSEVLDTLDRHCSKTILLEASTTNLNVPFAVDVAQARLIYIEADGEIEVSFGGAAATGAVVTGVGGTFPTLFTGGETLTLDIDNLGSVVTTFTAGASLAQDVANEINAAFALAGILSGGVPVQPATVVGGELRFTSPTTGVTSEVDVVAGSAGVIATLGLTVAVTNGVNSTPGTSDLRIQRPADPAGASAAAGVKAFALLTINTTSLQLTNLSASAAVNVTVLVVGDLTATP